MPRPIRHAFTLLAIATLAALAVLFVIPHWIWHPLTGLGYQFWSGIAGSFLTSTPGWVAAICLYWRAHNCHVHGCWGLQWHPHPEHEHPVCKDHWHEDGSEHVLTGSPRDENGDRVPWSRHPHNPSVSGDE